jgi:hypothetical protein
MQTQRSSIAAPVQSHVTWREIPFSQAMPPVCPIVGSQLPYLAPREAQVEMPT